MPDFLRGLVDAYPALKICEQDIRFAFEIMETCYQDGGKLLVCGNGGSAADAIHIVGELMKGFHQKRPLSVDEQKRLSELPGGSDLAKKLQGALPCIALTESTALLTAISNDVDPALVFAQQVWGYGRKGDVLLGISTSGNSTNVCSAVLAAQGKGIKAVGLTGRDGGKMRHLCDITICVPADDTYQIQEYHLPVYHTICAMLEQSFFE